MATLGANEIVGEMGILGDVPRKRRSAPRTASSLCASPRSLFMRMVREFPNMAVSIMQELAHRLESTNNQLRAALAEVKQLREGAGIAA